MLGWLPVVLLSALTAMATGCGTIVHWGGSQDVGIASNPAGAKVIINETDRGLTPVTVELKRKQTHTIVLKMDGYEDASATALPELSGWIWGNILIGGLIGLAIDLGVGGGYNVNPDIINITLTPRNSAISPEGASPIAMPVMIPSIPLQESAH
jgi:hypothetical protein